jgi:hypothetical protein
LSRNFENAIRVTAPYTCPGPQVQGIPLLKQVGFTGRFITGAIAFTYLADWYLALDYKHFSEENNVYGCICDFPGKRKTEKIAGFLL